LASIADENLFAGWRVHREVRRSGTECDKAAVGADGRIVAVCVSFGTVSRCRKNGSLWFAIFRGAFASVSQENLRVTYLSRGRASECNEASVEANGGSFFSS